MINSAQSKNGFTQHHFFLEKNSAGFTLIEVLVSMGILAMLGTLGLVFGLDFYRAYAFNSERDLAVGILQKARSRSLANINQTTHGVCIIGSKYILFEGALNCDPNNSANEVYDANPGVSNSGLQIVFQQLSGRPNSVGSVTLTSGVRSSVININAEGMVEW